MDTSRSKIAVYYSLILKFTVSLRFSYGLLAILKNTLELEQEFTQ